MKFILLLLLCALMVYMIPAEKPKCYDKNDECHSSNYESYMNCVRRRYKRSIDCDTSCETGNCINICDNCDCDSCSYRSCQNTCNSCCSSCCSNYISCRTNHCCHKTCHAQCKSSECRTECRRNCVETVKKTNSTDSNVSSSINELRPNVTTIIHLNNVINTTNIIDIPIVLNNTNHQNITLYDGSNPSHNSTRNPSQNSTSDEKCCVVISPRQCVPHNEYPFVRCFHYRSKQCGSFCTSAIVHKEDKQLCQSAYPGATPNCYQHTVYIPQPQPRCTYQSVWPYVTCGIQNPASCEGCYNHYVNENSKSHLSCSYSCYDYGFGAGTYYRQGPFYRPCYSHMPCYPCSGGYEYGGGIGYGGFGGYPPLGLQGFGYGAQIPGFGPQIPGFGPQIPGFGPQVPGFPSFASPIFPGTSLGSWAPGVESNFVNGSFAPQFNSSSITGPFDPLITVGPGLQYPYADALRGTREVEIEVNYEPVSSVQAEVKIKTDKIDNKIDILEDGNFTTLSSVTEKLA